VNRHRLICLFVLLTLGLSGCSRHVPTATVVLVDPSGSVTAQARKEEYAAVAALIPKMRRGDSLTIIPITDDEAADIQGRILRLQVPMRREAYDADLRRFHDLAGREYAVFAANLLAHPGQRTDILGALDVARQEFKAIPTTDRRRLVVLSDFLEDDGRYRFTSDPRLAKTATARQRATRLRREHGFTLAGVEVYLGALESTDFARLGPERRRAVRSFWSEYFAQPGSRTEVQLDGTGMLATLGNR
jgi:hypothetical protein